MVLREVGWLISCAAKTIESTGTSWELRQILFDALRIYAISYKSIKPGFPI
jgi:hypothetical protein